MRVERIRRSAAVVLLPLLVLLASCDDGAAVQTVNVSLKNSEVYQYPAAGGDEEGARISSQAAHYAISEIRRDAQTGWVSTYVYQPQAAFVGVDYVEIEILTGSDGASPPTSIKRVAFRFDVHN